MTDSPSSQTASGLAGTHAVPPGPRRVGSVLFTAFEPSGDSHAAPVIAALRQARSGLSIHAWGGPKMKQAGATIIEPTCRDAAMAHATATSPLPILDYWKRIRRIAAWAREHRPAVHVPVDSPAANFPICRHLQRAGARVVHLVAPQVWAWAPWRIAKLRRRTDLVLCLLPFEEPYLTDRGVPAVFIGHPTVNRELDHAAMRARVRALPSTSGPKVAILPGSRQHEIEENLGLLLAVFTRVRAEHPSAAAVIAASNTAAAKRIRRRDLPKGVTVDAEGLDAVIEWCDLALAVSGTVTLDVARQRKPMVAVYRLPLYARLAAKLIVRTPYRLLPNIVAGREIVPEFVPTGDDPEPVAEAALALLDGSAAAAHQREALDRVCLAFAGHDPALEAAKQILHQVEQATGASRRQDATAGGGLSEPRAGTGRTQMIADGGEDAASRGR